MKGPNVLNFEILRPGTISSKLMDPLGLLIDLLIDFLSTTTLIDNKGPLSKHTIMNFFKRRSEELS